MYYVLTNLQTLFPVVLALFSIYYYINNTTLNKKKQHCFNFCNFMKREGTTKTIENYEYASNLYHFHGIYCFLRLVLYVPHMSMSSTMPRYERDMPNWFRIQLVNRKPEHIKNVDGLCFGHLSCQEIRKYTFFPASACVDNYFEKQERTTEVPLMGWSHSSGNWALLQGHSPLM